MGRFTIGGTEMGRTIPKCIHQTYATLALPDELAASVRDLKARNPTWEHRLYDDEGMRAFIDAEYDATVLDAFDRIDASYGAARADLFRYLLIYRTGGMYLDIKSSIRRPIDEVLRGDESFVISRWHDEEGHPQSHFGIHHDLAKLGVREIQQWHIIAVAGHPFLGAVINRVLYAIDNYDARRSGVGRLGVLRVTGPIAYTEAITPILGEHSHIEIRNEEELTLEYSVLGSMTHQDTKQHYSKNTAPVIRRRGVRRILDLLFVVARTAKRKLLAQKD